MSPISDGEFARLLRGLDREAFAAFVVDLWSARGWTIRADTDHPHVVVATDGGSRHRRLLVHAPGRILHHRPRLSRERAVDAVVTTDPAAVDGPAVDGDIAVVGPRELREMAVYGLDGETRDALFRRHFDRPARTDARNGWSRQSSSGALARAAPLVLLVLLVGWSLGASVGWPLGGLHGPRDAGAPAAATTSGGRPTGTYRRDVTLPPGVSATGITNLDRLVSAHVALAANRSYRLWVRRADRSDSRFVGQIRQRIAVENRTVYRRVVLSSGVPRAVPVAVEPNAVYADGHHRYVHDRNRTAGYAVEGLSDRSVGGPAARAGDALRQFLAVNRSSLAATPRPPAWAWHPPSIPDGTRTFSVRGRGSAYPDASNYRVTALVGARGFVYWLHATYYITHTSVSVSVTLSYTDVGNATVRPPEWYIAGNGSG